MTPKNFMWGPHRATVVSLWKWGVTIYIKALAVRAVRVQSWNGEIYLGDRKQEWRARNKDPQDLWRLENQLKKRTMCSIFSNEKTRRSENDNTPQPLDRWTNSPFIGQQVGNCKSFTLTHYLADLFAMHRGPRSIQLGIQHHIQLTSLSFQVSRPSHS